MGVSVNTDSEVNTKGKKLLVDYLVKKKLKVLETILRSGEVEKRHLVHIHSQELVDISPKLFSQCMSDPVKWLLIFDKLLEKALDLVYEDLLSESTEASLFTKKKNVHLRIASLPADPWFQKTSFPKVEQVGLMIQLVGTVTKTVQRNMLVWRKDVKCGKCRYTFPMMADYEQYYTVPVSGIICPNPDGCPGTQFSVLNKMTDSTDSADTKDFQEIKIQEQVKHLSLGATPRSLWVTLEDDLVDSVKPGDDVEIIGVVKQRWKPGNQPEELTEIEVALKAHHLTVENSHAGNLIKAEEAEEEFKAYWERKENLDVSGRNKLLESFCPEVFGLYVAKLALAVVLAGGVEKVDLGGTRVRGEPHLLMVGDPGSGKSQLLRFASQIKARSVMISGTNTSAAGLTVSASSEGGEWHLEAGALVLADGGVCCIDEFNGLSKSDRACLHEAMEQQIISVAKAGMLTKLKTRCSVLAATNPKDEFDPRANLIDNTGIASPLLSRFDAVLVLVDTRNPDWDREVADFVLTDRAEKKLQAEDVYWTMARLQAYFSHVKTLRPQLSLGARRVLDSFYRRQRSSEAAGDGSEAARTTVRLLQSSVRLAQGHARLMSRPEVTTQDAVMAVVILEASNESWSSLIQGCNLIHSDFPTDAVAEYRVQARQVLTGLGLTELWEEEEARLEEMLTREPMVVPTLTQGTTQARPATDFSQMVREIQMNRATTLPPPQCKTKRKRKAGVKHDKRQRKANKENDEEDNSEDGSDGKEDNTDGEEVETKDSSGGEDDNTKDRSDVEEDDFFNPNFQSTQIERVSPSQGEISQNQGDTTTTPVLEEISVNEDDHQRSLSSKTQAKLERFRRVDREIVKENTSSEAKSSLDQLLACAGRLGRNPIHGEENKSKVKDAKFPWEENEDLEDFDFDL